MREKWQKLIWVFSLIFAAVLFGHFWFFSSSNIFTQNDLEANLLQIRYIRMSKFSSNWNPYISLPVWQDPLLGALNPFWAVPLLVFGSAELAVKTGYFLSLLMCGVGTYYLARSLKIGWKVAVIVAMTYLVSGFPTARIIAGQSEKLISLAFMPWILYLLLNNTSPRLGGFMIAMTLWSGDVYAYIYSLVIAGVLFKFKEIFWGMVFGLVRIVPILQISPYLYKPIEPLLGSQNLFSVGYHLFFPVKMFWGRLMNLVPSNFGWWEKAAYIGPISLLGIRYLIKLGRLNLVIWALILLSMVGWRTDVFAYFHVPTRVFGYLGLVILVAVATRIKNIYLWLLNLGFCISLTTFAYIKRPMPVVNPEMTKAILEIDPGKIIAFDQLANTVPILLTQETGIRMLATNYGVMMKNSDSEKWLMFRLKKEKYFGSLPDYIIYPNTENMADLKDYYVRHKKYNQISVFRKL